MGVVKSNGIPPVNLIGASKNKIKSEFLSRVARVSTLSVAVQTMTGTKRARLCSLNPPSVGGHTRRVYHDLVTDTATVSARCLK